MLLKIQTQGFYSSYKHHTEIFLVNTCCREKTKAPLLMWYCKFLKSTFQSMYEGGFFLFFIFAGYIVEVIAIIYEIFFNESFSIANTTGKHNSLMSFYCFLKCHSFIYNVLLLTCAILWHLIAHVVWKLTGDKVQITPFTPKMMFADTHTRREYWKIY